jgi:hypothetical protein
MEVVVGSGGRAGRELRGAGGAKSFMGRAGGAESGDSGGEGKSEGENMTGDDGGWEWADEK